MAVPAHNVTFSVGVEALRRQDAERRAREEQMRNALYILAAYNPADDCSAKSWGQFVRATAREGLGRE